MFCYIYLPQNRVLLVLTSTFSIFLSFTSVLFALNELTNHINVNKSGTISLVDIHSPKIMKNNLVVSLLYTHVISLLSSIFLINWAYFLISIRYRLYREITNKIRYIETIFIRVGFVPWKISVLSDIRCIESPLYRVSLCICQASYTYYRIS